MAKAKRTKSKAPKHETHLVRNRSSRRGSPVQAVAVHSTESSDIPHSKDDLRGVRGWFDNASSQASSHIGIDGDGNAELWVPSEEKAWTILELNDRTVNIEFVGRAAQPRKDWEEAQIKHGARWAAYWAIKYNFPIQRGVVKNVHGYPVITRKGVITHKQLTDAGFGSHTDPGPAFPIAEFIKAAQWYRKNGWYTS